MCSRYGLDITGSDQMCGWIGISCREVPEDAPQRGYGHFEALFRGVDQDGVWTETGNRRTDPRRLHRRLQRLGEVIYGS